MSMIKKSNPNDKNNKSFMEELKDYLVNTKENCKSNIILDANTSILTDSEIETLKGQGKMVETDPSLKACPELTVDEVMQIGVESTTETLVNDLTIDL